MCGIAGAFGGFDASDAVARMTNSLGHRGPDDEGLSALYCAAGGTVGALGQRRLAVLDLTAAGHQPMSTPDSRFTLVFNGEIYNFRQLRLELGRAGVEFRSDSDTEVLLHGWARHGRAFLQRLRGMFAFAIWDRQSGCGFLVRDPFGIKPLYLWESDGTVVFASEIRSLLASGIVARRLSRPGLWSYLETGAVAEPCTILQDVRTVPAGSIVEVRVESGRATTGVPQNFASNPLDSVASPLLRDPGEARALVRAALLSSVEHHMVSDVAVGIFLSGGIDSSTLVALAAQVAETPPETFTVATGADGGAVDVAAARAVANRYGTRHHEVTLSENELLQGTGDFFAAMDQPTMDGFNTYVVSRAVRNHGVKVVLSGIGGDELFGGYPSFLRAKRLRALRHLHPRARRALGAAAGLLRGRLGAKLRPALEESDPAMAAYRASRTLFGERQVVQMIGGATVRPMLSPPPELPLLARARWLEVSGYMRNILLRDGDTFSMAHGLELRVPFVDSEVAMAAATVDVSLPAFGRSPKPVLLNAVADLIPREVWDRRKQEFVLPFAAWLRGPLRQEVEAAFAASTLDRAGLDPSAVRALWHGFLRGDAGVTWSRTWALFALLQWLDRHDIATADAHPAEAAMTLAGSA